MRMVNDTQESTSAQDHRDSQGNIRIVHHHFTDNRPTPLDEIIIRQEHGNGKRSTRKKLSAQESPTNQPTRAFPNGDLARWQSDAARLQPVGMSNRGWDCYFSSLMQLYFSLPHFTALLTTHQAACPIGVPNCFACLLAEAADLMCSRNPVTDPSASDPTTGSLLSDPVKRQLELTKKRNQLMRYAFDDGFVRKFLLSHEASGNQRKAQQDAAMMQHYFNGRILEDLRYVDSFRRQDGHTDDVAVTRRNIEKHGNLCLRHVSTTPQFAVIVGR